MFLKISFAVLPRFRGFWRTRLGFREVSPDQSGHWDHGGPCGHGLIAPLGIFKLNWAQKGPVGDPLAGLLWLFRCFRKFDPNFWAMKKSNEINDLEKL